MNHLRVIEQEFSFQGIRGAYHLHLSIDGKNVFLGVTLPLIFTNDGGLKFLVLEHLKSRQRKVEGSRPRLWSGCLHDDAPERQDVLLQSLVGTMQLFHNNTHLCQGLVTATVNAASCCGASSFHLVEKYDRWVKVGCMCSLS